MNGREIAETGRACDCVYAQPLQHYLEFSLASGAYTLDVKYNTHSAIF
jgi:hypothetical protein